MVEITRRRRVIGVVELSGFAESLGGAASRANGGGFLVFFF